MIQQFTEKQLEQAYAVAREMYALYGVDTESTKQTRYTS